MSFVSRRRPLVEPEEKAAQRSSTSGLEPCLIYPHPPAKPALGQSAARLVTPETDQRLLLRGRLYNIRGKSYSEQKPKLRNFPPGSAPRDFSPACDLLPSGNDSPLLEPQSAMPVMSMAAAGDDSPVRVRRRKVVDFWGFQQKDLSTSLIEGGQLQRDEAALLRSKKAAQRKEIQEALSAQIAEKQGKKRLENLGLRASQPIKVSAFPNNSELIDLSPVLSGSTEDPEHRFFPSPTPSQPQERLIQLKAVPRGNPRIPMPPPEDESMNEFRKLRYPGSNSPERNVFGLNLEGRSDFLYPAEERVSFPGLDEIDRFLGQIGPFPGPIQPLREPESPKPGRLSEPSQSVASSFPRHVFGGRNYRRAARKAL